MHIVIITSPKDGVGKTSLSHFLALGYSLREDSSFPVILGHTDNRVPLKFENRGCDVVDMKGISYRCFWNCN